MNVIFNNNINLVALNRLVIDSSWWSAANIHQQSHHTSRHKHTHTRAGSRRSSAQSSIYPNEFQHLVMNSVSAHLSPYMDVLYRFLCHRE